MNKQQVGLCGEQIATDFLRTKGYKIKQKNFRCRHGEIDIIAEQRGSIVFVEVRSKTSTNFGSPEESMTKSKKQKLVLAAFTYLDTLNKKPESWRIDFVAVELDQDGKAKRIELIENAIC